MPADDRSHTDACAIQKPPTVLFQHIKMSNQLPAYQVLPGSYTDDPNDAYKNTVPVASCELKVRQMFIRKVYSLLLVQIFATVLVGSFINFNAAVKAWCVNNTWAMIIAFIGTIGFLLGAFFKSRSYPINLMFLAGFTFCEAFTLGLACAFVESNVVIQALLLTLVIFIGLTAFAFQTKYDFTSYQGVLGMGLWALIAFGFVFMFFPARSSGVELVYSGVGALIFSAYIVVDTQIIMKKFSVEDEIIATITLYLDVINLFLYILRFLNLRNDN